jgi:kumamolisin
MSSVKTPLPGSERQSLGTRVGGQPSDEVIDVSIVLKPKARAAVPNSGGATVSREDFAAQHGADPAVIEQIRQFTKEYNLNVIEASLERRTVVVEGTVADMNRAFDVALDRYEHQGEQYRGRTGAINVPTDFVNSVEAVLGLDNRPQTKPHLRMRDESAPRANASPGISYTPMQVASFYQFPSNIDGTGETIAILELGGGYKPADLKTYFAGEKIKEPTVISVSVDKGKNKPTNPNSADGEVLLDIEVAGSVAPGAKIVVYFAPNTTQGFQDALTTAIHDKTNKPSIISISWGGPESTWTPQSMVAFDSAAQDAAALGVSVCVASGDDGSSDGVKDGKNHVDFPASSPHVLACGGTSLKGSNGIIQSESVWNGQAAGGGASGGGFSTQFPLPSWQSAAGVTGGGRGVPDVAGDADPETGYQVLVDGKSMVVGGTSAVAPLWSGLIALYNQKLGAPMGFLAPVLYNLSASANAFHDITIGSNGAFAAGPGWDAATGLGSPSAGNLLEALSTGNITSVTSKGKSAKA